MPVTTTLAMEDLAEVNLDVEVAEVGPGGPVSSGLMIPMGLQIVLLLRPGRKVEMQTNPVRRNISPTMGLAGEVTRRGIIQGHAEHLSAIAVRAAGMRCHVKGQVVAIGALSLMSQFHS
jgi:hypothetical protein